MSAPKKTSETATWRRQWQRLQFVFCQVPLQLNLYFVRPLCRLSKLMIFSLRLPGLNSPIHVQQSWNESKWNNNKLANILGIWGVFNLNVQIKINDNLQLNTSELSAQQQIYVHTQTRTHDTFALAGTQINGSIYRCTPIFTWLKRNRINLKCAIFAVCARNFQTIANVFRR